MNCFIKTVEYTETFKITLENNIVEILNLLKTNFLFEETR